MRVEIIAPIMGLSVKHLINLPSDKLNIYWDTEFLDRVFARSTLAQSIGLNHKRALYNAGAFFYSAYKYADVKEQYDEADMLKAAFQIFHKVSGITFFLWFAKDCSAHVDILIANFPDHEGDCTMLPNPDNTSNSAGLIEDIEFTIEEIDRCMAIKRKYEAISTSEKVILSAHVVDGYERSIPSMMNKRSYNSGGRIDRAISFLNFARNHSFVPMKIAMYMPILEALFSTDSNEITHKIAERTALYIGQDNTDRLAIYEVVQNAYQIRSKMMHGTRLAKRQGKNFDLYTEQVEVSKQIDQLLRSILKKVILEDSEFFIKSSNEVIDNYFKGLLFSSDT